MNYKITIFVPLESIDMVRYDYGGLCYIQIDSKEYVTDEATYWRIDNAHRLRDQMDKEVE